MQINQKVYRVIGVFLLFYMFFVVGRTSYQSYKIDKKIEGMKKQVQTLENDNKQLTQDIEYFKTDAYREKTARQRLGLKKPDEKVIVIVPSKEPEKQKEEGPEKSNFIKWWDLFFGPKEDQA
ncbi:hypothetical protein COY62_00980 [bacterium (Candidatus Howlettbacteria) CG_4_10_14_0_8_um_filter_40_9]|nr:MAG: hypothetical protein COY62_00980 [bacterium (Candidatus Howlettbacteria) CG_4_10_14_0_8_um_filter_40_9]